jgi:hypothetical protein
MQTKMQEFADILIPKGSNTQQANSLGYFLIHYPETARVSTIKRDAKGGITKETEEAKNYEDAIESIRKIGRSFNEKKPDGIWGRRTQTAIKNIDIISGDLVQLAKDIEYPGEATYTPGDKSQLDGLIPSAANPSSEGVKDLGDRAEKITPILTKLNLFAEKLHQHLVDRYAQYSEKGDSFAGRSPIEEPRKLADIDEFNQYSIEQLQPCQVEYDGKKYSVSLNDLNDFKSFKEFLSKNLPGVDIDQWMADKDNYHRFLLTARQDILKELAERRQLLNEESIKDINKIKENIKELTIINEKIKRLSDGTVNYDNYINEVKPILREPKTYRTSESIKKVIAITSANVDAFRLNLQQIVAAKK